VSRSIYKLASDRWLLRASACVISDRS